MEEMWKDIPGYEKLYQVSNTGKVRSLDRYSNSKLRSGQKIRGKELRAGTRYDGYKLVVLCKDGKTKSWLVHRLVCLAFLPNPNNLSCINHKDENKDNNHVSNLEWCSYLYNNTYNGIAIRRQINKKKHWKLVDGRRCYY